MRVLLLCASHNDLGLLRSLKKLNAHIIITGSIPGLCGESMADEYVQMDYSDKEAILALAKEKQIDAILQCCNDFGVYTAAYVAEQLGLKGYDSYETTLLLHNKDRFKKYAEEKKIPSPRARYFSDEKSALEYLEGTTGETRYPLIVKPTDASAGNGIKRIDSYEDAVVAVPIAFAKSREKRIVIEPYITGSQHGFCTFLHDKKVVAYCCNNEYSFLNPYRVEIDTFPADKGEEVAPILIEQIEMIAEDLDLVDGIFHLQYILDEDGPHIIEVMRRVLGNMYSDPGNRCNDFDWDYWETRAKCGLSCDEVPQRLEQYGYFAYKTIVAEQNGVIQDIQEPENLKPYIWKRFLVREVGDVVENYMSQPVGFWFLNFPTKEKMKELLIDQYRNGYVVMKEAQ